MTPYLDLIDKKDFHQAIEKLEKALSEDPENPDFLNLVAYSHRNLGNYEIALNYYQKALKLDPDHRGCNVEGQGS